MGMGRFRGSCPRGVAGTVIVVMTVVMVMTVTVIMVMTVTVTVTVTVAMGCMAMGNGKLGRTRRFCSRMGRGCADSCMLLRLTPIWLSIFYQIYVYFGSPLPTLLN